MLLLSRLEAVAGTVGVGTGDVGGGTDSTGAVAPLLVEARVTDTRAGEGDEEVVDVGWAGVGTDEGGVSKRAIFAWGWGVPKLPSS